MLSTVVSGSYALYDYLRYGKSYSYRYNLIFFTLDFQAQGLYLGSLATGMITGLIDGLTMPLWLPVYPLKKLFLLVVFLYRGRTVERGVPEENKPVNVANSNVLVGSLPLTQKEPVRIVSPTYLTRRMVLDQLASGGTNSVMGTGQPSQGNGQGTGASSSSGATSSFTAPTAPTTKPPHSHNASRGFTAKNRRG